MNQKGFAQIIIFIILGVIVIGAIGYLTLVKNSETKPSKPEQTNPPIINNVPSDFEVQYSWGACHAEWGRNDLKINKEGSVELELSQGFFKENKKYSFTTQEISEIYGMFTKSNFFSLNPEYRNTGIVDGGCSSLTFNANGKSHKVSMSNKSPDQVVKITEKLMEILKSKDNNYSQINKKPICDEAKTSCVTGKEYKGASCNFWTKSCQGI